ncbi:hypothetical protein Rs2_30591 [Raphanus sativus]|nr:hypothetical protein Rs2_30591 [Raphanus sativus]
MASQRVVRHIKETSWPGLVFLPYFLMLCVSTLVHSHMAATFLTKCLDFCRQAYFDKLYGLYFEAAGIINYEDALRVDLTKDGASSAKHISTGPWVHLFLTRPFEDGIVLEFVEMTSSKRKDHWLMLVKEIKLMHQFLKKYNVESPLQAWEIHSRTISGIIRLHAAREMLKISPADPKKFLIFSLFEEVPKGDFILEELA